MAYYMDDVRGTDAGAIAKWASDPRFFYVYINNGGRDPLPAAKEYADLCEAAFQARKAGQDMPAEYPWSTSWAKGLRDEKGALCGVVVLLKEKAGGDTEIGYFLDPDLQGHGLATQMAMSSLKWARENTTLECLKGDVDPHNLASRKILGKFGLEVVEYHDAGHYRDRDGVPIGSMIMRASGDRVDDALRAYAQNGGSFLRVRDALLDATKPERQMAAPTPAVPATSP